ncbi:hypothetical protein ABZP36_015322 [Zizania latifolia]
MGQNYRILNRPCRRGQEPVFVVHKLIRAYQAHKGNSWPKTKIYTTEPTHDKAGGGGGGQPGNGKPSQPNSMTKTMATAAERRPFASSSERRGNFAPLGTSTPQVLPSRLPLPPASPESVGDGEEDRHSPRPPFDARFAASVRSSSRPPCLSLIISEGLGVVCRDQLPQFMPPP